jgi:hypothetical protein
MGNKGARLSFCRICGGRLHKSTLRIVAVCAKCKKTAG